MPRSTFRKTITSPELIAQINSKNLDLIEKFLKAKGRSSSEKTIESYRSDLNIFFCWNLQSNGNKFFVDIKKIEFSEFFSFVLDELKWGSERFKRMRSCLSSLSDFIFKFYDEEYPTYRNIILKSIESIPKSERREKTILSKEQVDTLLKELSSSDKQLACWFALAVSSGARFSEILRFTTDIIDPEKTEFNGLFIATTKPIKTKGRSKDGKMLVKYIIKDIFMPYYETWLVDREAIMKKNEKMHNSIFIREDGSPAIEGTARSWVKRIEKFLGAPFYAHCVRHYIVTYLSKVGLSSELIAYLMGWSSEDMVKIYNDSNATDREWKELFKLKEALAK